METSVIPAMLHTRLHNTGWRWHRCVSQGQDRPTLAVKLNQTRPRGRRAAASRAHHSRSPAELSSSSLGRVPPAVRGRPQAATGGAAASGRSGGVGSARPAALRRPPAACWCTRNASGGIVTKYNRCSLETADAAVRRYRTTGNGRTRLRLVLREIAASGTKGVGG